MIYPDTMKRAGPVLLISVVGVAVAALRPLAEAGGQPTASPEVLDVRSGALTLRAQVWRPSGSGPFPAVLFNHGSYSTDDPLPPSEPETVGAVFARHGYVFLWLHRQGTGLSSAQGRLTAIKWRARSRPKELKGAIACSCNYSRTNR